jgi:glycosyltransferase involved in cell wall biosynthesis
VPEPTTTKPRVLFVAATRYTLPLSETLTRKWDALADTLDLRVLARGTGDGDPRFVLALPGNGVRCQLAMPGAVARQLREFQPDAVLTQGPFEAFASLKARRRARWDGPVIADVHGNWRSATRLYGSPLRGLASYPAQLIAWLTIRRVDGVRTLSPFTSELVRSIGVEPLAEFPAFVDLDAFLDHPPAPFPAQPRAAFVGVLEPYKGLRTLQRAWEIVRAQLPDAQLAMVGQGHARSKVEEFVRRSAGSVTWVPRLANADVPGFLDDATCLVMSSQTEGLPRVAMEAFCRGRAVIATSVGGLPDLVDEGSNGLLVERGDAAGLAAALIRVLGDPAEAERLGARAARTDGAWKADAVEFAARTRRLVDAALAGRSNAPA